MAGVFHCLVDLDGTLVDPKPGIVGSVRFALAKLGLKVPEVEELLWVIGPPLRTSFPRLGVPIEHVEEAVGYYRANYAAGAMFDAPVYPGISEALAALRHAGFRLVVATSKPHVYARPILEKCKLIDHFVAVHGAELDGRNDDKGDLLAHIIEAEKIDPARAVMIGDRLFDVRAARRHSIPSIGVLWGYGDHLELSAAGANVLCDTPGRLPGVVAKIATTQFKSD